MPRIYSRNTRLSTGYLIMSSEKIFVPGRLCLFGEHSDWAGTYQRFNAEIRPGLAIVAMLNQGIYATVRRSTRVDIRYGHERYEGEASTRELAEYVRKGEFMRYAVATVLTMIRFCHGRGRTGREGIEIRIDEMDLPIGAGLSSSAAICVLVVKAYDQLYGLGLEIGEIMDLAYRGEIITGSRCGRMDQLVAYNEGIVTAQFADDRQGTYRIKVGATLYFVVAILRGEKDTVRILSELHSCFPWPKTEAERKAAWFLTTANDAMVSGARANIAAGDLPALAQSMLLYQADFDRYIRPVSPTLSSSSTIFDTLSNDKRLHGGYLAMKGVGSHGDGAAMFLCEDLLRAGFVSDYLRQEYGIDSLLLTIEETP